MGYTVIGERGSGSLDRSAEWMEKEVAMEDGKVIVKQVQRTEKQEGTGQNEEAEEMKVLVSGVLRAEGRTFVRVSFLRGKDWAEGLVPDGVIEKSDGFTEEEIGRLEDYLTGDKDTIIRQAKGINPIRNLFNI